MPNTNDAEYERAADTLRAWALDENLKARVMTNPLLAPLARRVANRYSAGETVTDALAAVTEAAKRGHLGSIEYAGESVRDADIARAETDVFLHLAAALTGFAVPTTVSFDLSHIGSTVSYELGLAHARELAAATRESGSALMISAEGSDRTDLVLDLYDAVATEYPHLGITLQARLHRSPGDLDRLLRHPGPIRLVKGAFLESDDVAIRRGQPALTESYLHLAGRILDADHAVSFATHDADLLDLLTAQFGAQLMRPNVEFEMLRGLAPDLLDSLRNQGYRTREYAIFGGEWWLYVLNRIAEQPERAITALADLQPPASA
jgi:proline dehydrogenase